MNVQILLLHIHNSNLEYAIKQNLLSIIDKAVRDTISVSNIERRIISLEKFTSQPDNKIQDKAVAKVILKELKDALADNQDEPES